MSDRRSVQRHSWAAGDERTQPRQTRAFVPRIGGLIFQRQNLDSTDLPMARYGYNHQTVYRRAAGTSRFLYTAGIHDERTLRWVNKTRIVPVSEVSEQEPTVHDAGVSFIAIS